MDEMERAIAAVNSRLRASGHRVSIEAKRGSTLYLRATLPPKPGSGKRDPYRQRIATGHKVTEIGLRRVEKEAQLLSTQIVLGKFDWANWGVTERRRVGSGGDWLKKFEEHFWKGRARTASAENTWKVYWQVLKKIPLDRPLDLGILISVLSSFEPDSRARQRGSMILTQLANFIGLETEPILALAGNYSASSIKARNLPDDVAIAGYHNQIIDSGWRWVYGLIATYGLRPHEVFIAELDEFPTVWVPEASKTGERFVYPLYLEWAEEWQLCDRTLPGVVSLERDSENLEKLGYKISKWFYRSSRFRAYDLRHSYARRCFEASFPPDLVAKLMGHSLQVQLNTYRTWWGEFPYRKVYETYLNNPQRPKPPIDPGLPSH